MKATDVKDLSSRLIELYHACDTRSLAALLDEDLLFAGPSSEEIVRGKKDLLAFLEGRQWGVRPSVTNLTCEKITLRNKVFGVIASYHLNFGPRSSRDQACHMSLTWVYTRAKGESEPSWKARMIHAATLGVGGAQGPADRGGSAAEPEKAEGAAPAAVEKATSAPATPAKPAGAPTQAGTEAAEKTRNQTMLIGTRLDRSTAYFPIDQITFIKNQGHHAIVHTADGKQTELTANLRRVREENPGIFLHAHASYLVNPRYVTGIERFRLILSDGERIPVPERKYTKVKAALRDAMENMG